MRDCSLEGQVYAYWLGCHDLRLAREAGADDSVELEDIVDLGRFTDHARLRTACLSRVKCDVVEAASL
jgi:hypothetical protein